MKGYVLPTNKSHKITIKSPLNLFFWGVPGYLLSVFFAAQIVSLASWDDKTLLLRIGHQFGVDEDGGPRGAAVRCSGRGDILGGTKDIQGLRASENCSSLDIFSNLSIEPS